MQLRIPRSKLDFSNCNERALLATRRIILKKLSARMKGKFKADTGPALSVLCADETGETMPAS